MEYWNRVKILSHIESSVTMWDTCEAVNMNNFKQFAM